MVAVGHSDYGETSVAGWMNITEIAAGNFNTVGLKADGSVVATGDNSYGQCDVHGWEDIIQVAAGSYRTVGLKADGTVIAAGSALGGQYLTDSWTDIAQVAAGMYHTVGLKRDGTVVAAGPDIELAEWNLGVVEYSLTIGSTAGGRLIRPAEGTSTYNGGVTVALIARPDNGFRSVKWVGDVETVANVNAATTVITMRGNYAVTATFPLNWPLIGGILAGGAVAAALSFFFVRRARNAGAKKQARRRSGRKKRQTGF